MTPAARVSETPCRDKKAYAWVVVGLLWGVALLNYMDRQMLSTMKAAMMGDIRELQSAENFGRLMAVFLWVYGLMSPVAGLIADRLNRKRLIVGSLAVWSAVTLGMGFVTRFDVLYALRALMGVSEALYIPAGLALIADYHAGNTRSLAVGVHMTGLYLGQALGGFGAAVALKLSWQQTFRLFGLIGIAYSVVLIALLREKRDGGEPAQGPAAAAEHPVAAASREGLRAVFRSLSLLLGTASFWVILFYFAAPSFPGWGIKNWLPTLFSKTLGLGMEKAGPMATIATAGSSFFGVIIGGILADRWMRRTLRGRIYTGAIGLSLTLPALLLLGFGTGVAEVLGGAAMFGVGFGMFDANNMPILCQFVPPRRRAAGYGILNLAGVFAGAVVTSLLGKSTDAGRLGHDIALLAIPVALAVALQLAALRPTTADMREAGG